MQEKIEVWQKTGKFFNTARLNVNICGNNLKKIHFYKFNSKTGSEFFIESSYNRQHIDVAE